MARPNPNKRLYPREYRIWKGLRVRCTNPRHKDFRFYGAKGISTDISFDALLADIGPAPSPEHTLDRVNTLLGYIAGNLRWATRCEQANNSRWNRRYLCDGDWLTTRNIMDRFHCVHPYHIVSNRLVRGWTIHDAVTLPIIPQHLKRLARPKR